MVKRQMIDSGAVRNLLLDELRTLAEQIKQNHKAAGQVASGRTLRSIRAEVLAADGNQAHGVIWGRFPFGTLETGRRGANAGKPKVPGNFREIILQWMEDKGIHANGAGYKTQAAADRSLAFLIARKIQRTGTKLHRTGGRADIYSNVIPDALERIEDKLGAFFAAQIDTITLNV